MTPILMFLQAPSSISELQWFSSLGVGGSIAGLVIVLWRKDRAASEERYASIAREFRNIVEDNTRAIATLTTIVQRPGLVECPYAREQRDRPRT